MKYFLFFFFIFTNLGFSEITTICSFQEVEKDLENLSTEALVLFDIDEVLVTPSDMVLKPIGASFKPKCFGKISAPLHEELLSIMLANTKYVLVDPRAPNVIKKLVHRKVPTMGFTSCRTGEFGAIESMENWRYKQLNDVSIDFSSCFPKIKEHPFFELVDKKAHPPIFKKGILFSGDFYNSAKSTKGELLGIFLNWIGYEPDVIVFFDDEMKNLIAVQEELKKRKIPFKGYLLKKTSALHIIDEEVAEMQFQILLEERKWYSDQTVKNMLSSRENA